VPEVPEVLEQQEEEKKVEVQPPAPISVEPIFLDSAEVAVVIVERIGAPQKAIRIKTLPKRHLMNRGIIRNHCQK
jgi:hypothetical protein